MRENTRLRRRCEKLAAELELPDPFDLTALAAQVAARRGRPIQLMAATWPLDGVCGLWLVRAEDDLLCYASDTTVFHQRQIVGHELGHLLFEHDATTELGPDLIAQVLPDLDPGLVRRVLGRGSYGTVEEREAEMFAVALNTRIHRQERSRAWPAPDDPVLARIERALGPRRRR